MYDLLIIGSGPAGVSAALSAEARHLDFLWFGSRSLSPKIEKAECIMNYPGLPKVTGTEMRHMVGYPTEILGENRAAGIICGGETVEAEGEGNVALHSVLNYLNGTDER